MLCKISKKSGLNNYQDTAKQLILLVVQKLCSVFKRKVTRKLASDKMKPEPEPDKKRKPYVKVIN